MMNDETDGELMIKFEGGKVTGASVSDAEETLIQKFLYARKYETRKLTDIIMAKLIEKETQHDINIEMKSVHGLSIPPKVADLCS